MKYIVLGWSSEVHCTAVYEFDSKREALEKYKAFKKMIKSNGSKERYFHKLYLTAVIASD